MRLRTVFWGSLAGLAWTHAGYPLAAAALARAHQRPIRKDEAAAKPDVTVVVAAHNEERVIRRRLENLLELDYPPERLEVVVASDGSTDATKAIVAEIAAADPRVRLLDLPRAGKVAAQDAAVAATSAPAVAFSDANATWAPDALARLVSVLADPDVGYVCGQVRLERPEGENPEPLYWRYELWLRASESALGSITGGNGAIYAVRRADYVGGDTRFGHDLGFPYLMVQRGRRAVYEPAAIAYEKPGRASEDEYRRKVRMFAQCWLHLLSGRMFRRSDPLYLAQLVSHRVLRYGSGLLHVTLFASSLALASRAPVYRTALTAQLAWLGLAGAGRARAPVPGAALAYYYFLVTSATLVGLANYLRSGVPVVWEQAVGTR